MYTQVFARIDEQEDDSEEPPGHCKPERVLLIYSVVDALARGEAQDRVTDEETTQTAFSIADALQSIGYEIHLAAIRTEDDVVAATAGYDPRTTLVFNLCEALGETSSGESLVPLALDKLGFCYSGAHAECLNICLNKAHTKARLRARGVSTAPYQVFRSPTEPIRVPLPAIVKPVAEDCSLGITRDSVVFDDAALRRQVEYVLDTYKQPALVELFLNGREFNIGLWGNGTAHVLPIAESDYAGWDTSLRVLNFDAKWNAEAAEYNAFSVLCPAPVDRVMAAQIRRLALDAYRVMGCRDYARVDMREKDGQLYVLEVNPNPCLATDAGFANAARVAGFGYAHMAHQIVGWAWRRRWEER